MSAGLIVETVGTTTFGFDFVGQHIEVDAGTDVLYVSTLWEAIKLAQWTTRGWENGQIAKGGGLDELEQISTDRLDTFLTIKLLEEWEIKSLKTSGKFTIKGGNVTKANGLDPFVDNPLITHFLFLSQAGTVARVQVGSGVTPTDKAEIISGTKAAILSDGHAFPGAHIDAAISSVDGGLTEAQAAAIVELQLRMLELWRLQGLDTANPLVVAAAARSAASITQSVVTVGTTTTITRTA